MTSKIISILQFAFFGAFFMFIAWVFVGFFVQHQAVTVNVTGKTINQNITYECDSSTSTIGQRTTCESETSYSYIVYTEFEKFSTSPILYQQIEIDHKYVFNVIGWTNFRFITEILEGKQERK